MATDDPEHEWSDSWQCKRKWHDRRAALHLLATGYPQYAWCHVCVAGYALLRAEAPGSKGKWFQELASIWTANPSPCWCKAGWEDYCYCIFTDINISVLKSRPHNFLGLNHDAPQRVPFCRTLLCKRRSSRILSINCGSRVVLGLKWFECLQVQTCPKHNIKFPTYDRFRTKPRHCVFWPARPPQKTEGVAFSNKLCSFEFDICSQSGFCETSGIGTLAKFVSSKEMLAMSQSLRARRCCSGRRSNPQDYIFEGPKKTISSAFVHGIKS